MNSREALDQIADHMQAFNLGVSAEDHTALLAQIAEVLLEFDDAGDLWRGVTLEHIAAIAEDRPPANWACPGGPGVPSWWP